MVRRAERRPDGTGRVLVALTVPGARCATRSRTGSTARCARRRRTGSTLDFTVMTDSEREDLRIRLHGNAAATPTATASPQGHAEGRPVPFNQPGSKTRRC